MLKCLYVNNKSLKNKFLSLPKILYKNKINPQDIALEKSILNGTHILSKNFEIKPYVVLDSNDKPQARGIMTYYPNDIAAYVGFFESVNNQFSCDLLLQTMETQAKKDGKTTLVGPLDCSFWIRYRFKTNNFETVYTSEPYNLEYYPLLWEKYGFKISDHYSSNCLRIPTNDDIDEKCVKRYNMVIDKGYEIKHPTKETFDDNILEIYELLTKLYSTFPTYKPITKDEFKEMFSSLKLILDFNIVNLAYKDDKLVGFFISVPNYYENAIGTITIKKLLSILKIKKNPKEYISLYLGADMKHLGLGGAFAEMAKRYYQEKNATSVSALMHDDKASALYYKNLTYKQNEYNLYTKEIS